MKRFGIRFATGAALLVGLAGGGGCSGDDGSPPRVDSGGGIDAGPGATDAGGGGMDGGEMDAGGGSDVDAGSGGDCGGGCASGFHCTTGGYCASETGVPAFGRVYVIEMENHSLTSVVGSARAPYLNGLIATYATATNYGSITHPSLPNYIAMVSGDTGGIGCDCHPTGSSACSAITCNLILSNCRCNLAGSHLGNQLDAVGVEWREYGEGMGSPCNPADSGGSHYAAKHVPFLYFDDVYGDSARCAARVRDYGDFAADLATGTYRFLYVSPNLCNDMHDACGADGVSNGDNWSSTNVPPILATPGFAAGGTDVLFIVWDEQDGSLGTAPLPFIVVSPLVRGGASTAMAYDHYSLLATWEDAFGVPRLGMAVGKHPIDDIWR